MFVLDSLPHYTHLPKLLLFGVDEVSCSQRIASTQVASQALQVNLAGRERTAAQWKALLAGAGFKLTRIVACRAPLCVVEAVPA